MPTIDNIPEQLLSLQHYEDDVSILIGENGSGKSTLLNNLAKYFLKNRKNVVALANSIHDKFDVNHRNFNTLRGRSGRRQTRSTIKNALENIAESDIQRLKYASRALGYVQFDPMIGFKIDKLNSNYNQIISDSTLTDQEKEEINYLLLKSAREGQNNEIIWLEVEGSNLSEIEKSSLTELFKWEAQLKILRVIGKIEVFLRRNRQTISMLAASSGELALITSIVYLSTVITDRTVILIDEPENSLHPRWQKEYAKILLDIFYLYQPKIIIATHSPLVVNGAELFIKDPKIYKADSFTFKIQNKEPLNVEETLYRFFDLTTPQNRFLSDLIVRYVNLLANEKITLESFQNEIEKIMTMSYDPKQRELLDSIKLLGVDVARQNQ
jgi:predicted ATPase